MSLTLLLSMSLSSKSLASEVVKAFPAPSPSFEVVDTKVEKCDEHTTVGALISSNADESVYRLEFYALFDGKGDPKLFSVAIQPADLPKPTGVFILEPDGKIHRYGADELTGKNPCSAAKALYKPAK